MGRRRRSRSSREKYRNNKRLIFVYNKPCRQGKEGRKEGFAIFLATTVGSRQSLLPFFPFSVSLRDLACCDEGGIKGDESNSVDSISSLPVLLPLLRCYYCFRAKIHRSE